jgi:hypothetical protein
MGKKKEIQKVLAQMVGEPISDELLREIDEAKRKELILELKNLFQFVFGRHCVDKIRISTNDNQTSRVSGHFSFSEVDDLSLICNRLSSLLRKEL